METATVGKTRTEILISGFGGQGVIRMGQILGLAAIKQGHRVTMLKSHGTETRGGYVRAQIVISPTYVDSPVVEAADVFVAFSALAKERLNNVLFANMIMLGALTRLAGMDYAAMKPTMLEVIPRFHEQNLAALARGLARSRPAAARLPARSRLVAPREEPPGLRHASGDHRARPREPGGTAHAHVRGALERGARAG